MPNTSQTARIPQSTLGYDSSTARYRGPNGRFLSQTSIRRVVENDVEVTRERMQSHARVVQKAAQAHNDGELSRADYEAVVDQWQGIQAREMKGQHVAYLAAGKGGFHNLEPSDYGRAGGFLKPEYGYLKARAQAALDDPEYASSAAFINHVGQYADAPLATFEATRLQAEIAAGLVWEVNLLDDNEHTCKRGGGKESCQQQSDKGVVVAGALVRWGGCACGNRCRCDRMRFKTKEAAEAALRALGLLR